MTAAKRDLVIEKGATFRLNLRLKDAAGAYMNLTGYVGRMQVRATVTADTPLLDLAGAQITFDAAGSCQVRATATLTMELPLVKAVYDLEIESPSGEVDRLLEGKVTISPNVTRPPGTAP